MARTGAASSTRASISAGSRRDLRCRIHRLGTLVCTAIMSGAVAAATILTAPPANAEPRCMNYLWYSACHDPVTNKWQVCNFNHDGQCHDEPPPLAPSPFDPIR